MRCHTVDKKIYKMLKLQAKQTRALTQAFVASKSMQPMSTSSERLHHQVQFKDRAIQRYNAMSPTSNNHIRCSVLGEYIRRDAVVARHLCSIQRKDVLPMLGKSFTYLWDPENCVLMYTSIEKAFDAMDITLLPHPSTHTVTLQVLYDDVLARPVISDFGVFEGYTGKSSRKRKIFREGYKTFGDLDGKTLLFPVLVMPSKSILQWAAKSAYMAVLNDDHRSHECAVVSQPSEEEWEAIAQYVSLTISVNLHTFVDKKRSSEQESSDNESEEFL